MQRLRRQMYGVDARRTGNSVTIQKRKYPANIAFAQRMSALGSNADISATCPPYPRKRTSQRTAGMSALSQKRHYCSAANCSLLDHFVGAVRAEIDPQAQTWLAAQLGSRTELLPVACFEFFISGLTSNACPNPRT